SSRRSAGNRVRKPPERTPRRAPNRERATRTRAERRSDKGMNHDQNKKTLRQFQCRDYLWEIFEQMSAELECSVDYLINESMRQYARSRNYGVRTPGPSQHAPPMPAPRPQPSIPSAPPPPPGRGAGSYPGSFGAPPPSAGYPPPPASPRPSYGAPAQ